MRNKRISILFLTFIFNISLFVGCNSEKDDKIQIGILQLIQHEALDSANKGFVDALKENGYIDGDNISIEQKNAQGKIDVAKLIANQFVDSDKDLIFSIATPATQAVLNSTDKIPVVFSAVTDPVADGLVKSLSNSGNNATGTSDNVDINEQLELMKELIPNVKVVGIIYTTSETNSINQVKELKSLAEEFDIKIKEIGISNINEINQNLSNTIKDIDVLYVPTDNNVAASYDLVGSICIENNIPAISAESAMVNKGGLFSKSLDYYELGYMAGEKAVEILEGKDPSDIEVEMMKELKITINTESAKKLKITIPDEILDKATLVTGGKK